MTSLEDYENPELFAKSKGKNPSYFRKNQKAQEPMGLTNHNPKKETVKKNVKIIASESISAKHIVEPLEMPDHSQAKTGGNNFAGQGEVAGEHVQQPLGLAI